MMALNDAIMGKQKFSVRAPMLISVLHGWGDAAGSRKK